jgi:hypothetical protein
MLRKRLMALLLLAVVLAMVVGTTMPATAQLGGSAPPQTTVFVPPQTLDVGGHQYKVSPPGGTLACSGASYTAPSGTCTPLGDRTPNPGLVCDIPARVLAFGILPLSAFECHTPSTTSAPVDLENVSPGSRQFLITDDPNSFNSVRFR